MKKMNYLFGAAAMAIAMVLVSCSATDLPVDPNEPKIHNGDDLVDVIANGENIEIINGVPTLNLPAGVSLTLNDAIENNAPLAIKGDAANPATIKIGELGRVVTTGGIQFENVIIDASEQTQPLVTLGVSAPEEWESSFITFVNVDVIGLKKALTYAACKNYDVVSNIDNCRIQVAADVTVFDYTKGSAATILNLSNSTIWAPEATTKSLYSSQGGQKATEYDADATQLFQFDNSTFYNLAKSKNFFTHRQNSQKWLQYSVKDCIFVNCGKSGQTIMGMNGGGSSKNPTYILSGNVFNFDGADTSANEYTFKNDSEEIPVPDSKAVVVNFVDAANGDFSQKDAAAGDPRWIPLM